MLTAYRMFILGKVTGISDLSNKIKQTNNKNIKVDYFFRIDGRFLPRV